MEDVQCDKFEDVILKGPLTVNDRSNVKHFSASPLCLDSKTNRNSHKYILA